MGYICFGVFAQYEQIWTVELFKHATSSQTRAVLEIWIFILRRDEISPSNENMRFSLEPSRYSYLGRRTSIPKASSADVRDILSRWGAVFILHLLRHIVIEVVIRFSRQNVDPRIYLR